LDRVYPTGPGKKLIGAGAAWARPAYDLGEAASDFRAFGIPVPVVEEVPEYEVWEENWDAFELFLHCAGQWRYCGSTPVSLDRVAVIAVLGVLQPPDRHRELLTDLALIERGAVNALRQNSGE
jgi:hypothetical protein